MAGLNEGYRPWKPLTGVSRELLPSGADGLSMAMLDAGLRLNETTLALC